MFTSYTFSAEQVIGPAVLARTTKRRTHRCGAICWGGLNSPRGPWWVRLLRPGHQPVPECDLLRAVRQYRQRFHCLQWPHGLWLRHPEHRRGRQWV